MRRDIAPGTASAAATEPAFSGWRYGALGLPLAFVSLPLYVTLPHHYAQEFGIPLAALGAVLLATRALDAVMDPLIGRWVDDLFAAGVDRAWRVAALAALGMALAFAALWRPPAAGGQAALAWLAVTLVATYLTFSVVSVVHQAWGARWSGTPLQRARIVAWREGAALPGVVSASLLPGWLGLNATSVVLGAGLAIGMAMLGRTRPPDGPAPRVWRGVPARHDVSPWSSSAFRALLAVFVLNGVGSAIPATLLPFYVGDRLQDAAREPMYLTTYFVCAGVGLPLWLHLVKRHGLSRTWLVGMGLSVMSFLGVLTLGAGDGTAFLAICAASGLALGADLAVPGALLTGVVRHAGAAARGEGRFFGWWACAMKLNLALAAGVALPLLTLAGYRNGTHEPRALIALCLVYGALPCALKLGAAVVLWRVHRQHPALGACT